MKNYKFEVYKEKIKHGSTLFPFVIYNNLLPDFFTKFPLHWHEEIEIIYAIEGKSIYNVNYNNLIIEEGDILFISPSILHSFSQYKSYNFKSKVILFNLNIINNTFDICASNYFSPLLNNKCTPYFILKKTDLHYYKVKNYLDNMITCNHTKNNFFELQLKGYIINLLYLLFSENLIQICDTKTENKNTKLIKQIITYIKDNYQKNIKLQDLSNKFNLSPYHISHVFKKLTSMSCIDYIIEYRLNMAHTLLRDTDLPIISIALETGFNNISYFNRAYKKRFNITPTQYRLQCK